METLPSSSSGRSICSWLIYPSAALERFARIAGDVLAKAGARAPHRLDRAATSAAQPVARSSSVTASSAAGPTKPVAAAHRAPGSSTIIDNLSAAAALRLPTTFDSCAALTISWRPSEPTDESTWIRPEGDRHNPCAMAHRWVVTSLPLATPLCDIGATEWLRLRCGSPVNALCHQPVGQAQELLDHCRKWLLASHPALGLCGMCVSRCRGLRVPLDLPAGHERASSQERRLASFDSAVVHPFFEKEVSA